MADAETPSLWQFVPVVTGLAGAGMSLYGGNQAAQGAIAQGDMALAAGQRSGAAYRDLGVRQAANERIKAARAKAAAEFAAKQYEVNAGQQIAAGQRDAVEERRQSNLVASRARAVAAASGAGAADPSVVSIVGRIKGEGAYRAATALYAGEDKARVLRMQAAAKNYEGLTAEEAGELNAQEALLANEAKATSEEAKGVAASSAARTNATSAKLTGLRGALPGVNALAAGGMLADKYGWFSSNDSADNPDMGPVAGSSDEQINEGLADESLAVESEAAIANDAAYYDAASGMAAGTAAVDVAAAADYSWLELLDF